MQRVNVAPSLQAQERLEALIRDQGLRPGDRLPTERELAAAWEISRSAVRGAIRRLVARRMLYHLQGSGTYVAAPRVIRNLRDVRSFAEVAAAAGRDLTTRVLSCTSVRADMGLADRLGTDLGAQVHHLRRLRFIDGQPAALESSFLEAARCLDLPEIYTGDRSLYALLHERYGIDVTRGYEQLAVASIDAEDARLLDIEPGTAVFSLFGVADDAAGAPVEYFTSLVRSDQVGFASMLQVRP